MEEEEEGECFFCGKEGHFKSECRKLKAELDGSGGSQANKASSTATGAGFLFMATQHRIPNDWIIDSGASQHMTFNRDLLDDYEDMATEKVHLADKTVLEAIGKGSVTIWVQLEGRKVSCRFRNVWFVPKLERNLLSVPRITEQGYHVVFLDQSCQVKAGNGQAILRGVKQSGIYLLQHHQHVAMVGQPQEDSKQLWHQRLGHLNMESIRKLARRGLISDIETSGSKESAQRVCEVCTDGKITRKPFPAGRATRAQEVLGIVHTDVCGPMSVISIGGEQYFTLFIDDWSRATFLYLVKKKSDVLNAFKEFEAWATTFTGRKIKILRSDNGGEYTGTAFKQFCIERGIERQFTVPYTPEQNGVAERSNRTIVEMGRCLLSQAGLEKRFWGPAVRTAAYLRNRCPSAALEDGKTPFELFTGQKLSLEHLRTFGCVAYAHLPAQKRDKLDSKALKCIFIGYSSERKAYRLYHFDSGRILDSRDVVFDENAFWNDQKQLETVPETSPVQIIEEDTAEDMPARSMDSDDEEDEEEDAEAPQLPQRRKSSLPVPSRTSNRVRTAPGEWWKASSNTGAVAFAVGTMQDEPRSYQEALHCEESKQWEKAIADELASLEKNGTWELVELPPGRKTVGCKWVFKKKLGADGTVERFKARLVAKGFSQQPGLDFQETFAPVAKFSSVRLLLSLAASLDLEIHQLDVKTAFLNGVVEEEIYMEQPEGCIAPGNENLVCRLKKSLYGLKQAPRAWNQHFDGFMQSQGFKRCKSESCIYFCKTSAGSIIYLLVYVDDLIIATKDIGLMENNKREPSGQNRIDAHPL